MIPPLQQTACEYPGYTFGRHSWQATGLPRGRFVTRSYARTGLGETSHGSLLIIIAIEDGEQFRDGQ